MKHFQSVEQDKSQQAQIQHVVYEQVKRLTKGNFVEKWKDGFIQLINNQIVCFLRGQDSIKSKCKTYIRIKQSNLNRFIEVGFGSGIKKQNKSYMINNDLQFRVEILFYWKQE
ncbi:unnamed protein product [Paramecium sonneborni]|uniref:Uncharacterized protein n=1 Tax=Paramecium sonneborni TaxID=65129 RepID=A0A8S1PPD6_9CILI|nr:unnamed protein product [Paramecium sonneborni]